MPHDEFFTLAFYRIALFNAIRIAFIAVFAFIATWLISRLMRGLRGYVARVMRKTGTESEMEIDKRTRTVEGVLSRSVGAVVWAIALAMILKELNFDIGPLLAGAGVVGVAIGFGAQSLIKDVLAGIFILLDNQIRINDVAVINGTGGLVEEINLRTTLLRSEDGAVHVFPNGSITKLSNLTREYSYAVFSLSMNYQEDTDHVIQVLCDLAEALRQEPEFAAIILAPLEVMGVDQFTELGVVIKARFKTLPMQQWTVAREMNRRVKKQFEQAGIHLAFPAAQIARPQ